jgi:hypothetical protein
LTRWEYVASVREALGVDVSAEAAALPQELRTEGFYNTAKDLRPTLERVTLWSELAARVVAKIANLGELVGRYTSCRVFGDECETQLIGRLGRRLGRRPLRAEEIAGFRPVFAAARSCGRDFDQGARAVLEALLQSPQFLYRTERQRVTAGGTFAALDGHEIAARISYLVTGGPPDDTLAAAADRGELESPDRRAEHVRRLAAGKAAVVAGLRFANDWLTLDELDGTMRDSRRFPAWNEALRADIKQESLRMIEDVLFTRGRPLAALLTTEETVATPALAALYGLPSRGAGWQRYDLGKVVERKGLLTTAGVLMRSGGGDAAVVARSLFVFRDVLCRDVGSPPAGIDTAAPAALAGGSRRALAEHRTNDPVCGGCHRQFEPLAFGFEPYDAIGAYRRTDDNGHVTRTDGAIPGPGPAQAYANIDEYMDLLARHPDAHRCLVSKPYQFAIGRAIEEADACTIEDLGRALNRTDGSYRELLVALVRHPTFVFVRKEAP